MIHMIRSSGHGRAGHNRKLPAFILLALLLLAIQAAAQEQQIQVQSMVDRATVTVGDSITYSLVISRAEGVQIAPLEVGSNLGQFEVRDYRVTESAAKAGKAAVDHYDFVISIYETGEFEIPPVTVAYRDQAGVAREVSAQPIHITVTSVLPGEAEDIKDIKPPVSIKVQNRLVLWLGLGVALCAAVVLLYLWTRRRTGAKEQVEQTAPLRPAHEIAYEELQRIEALGLVSRGQIKQHYTEVSEVIRRYVGQRYHILTLELTTAELIDAMAEAKVEPQHIDSVGSLLEECDLVKFAKYVPDREQIQTLIVRARCMVDAARETPLSPAGQAPAEEMGQVHEGVNP